MTLHSIASLVHAHTADKGDARAITYPDGTLSWRELDRRSNALARALIDRGVVRDDFVAIMLPNGIDFHIAAAATWKAGATPCIISSKLPLRELSEILAVATPRVIIGGSAAGLENYILVGPFDGRDLDDSPLPDAAATYWKAVASGGSTGRPKIIVDHRAARLEPATIAGARLGMDATSVVLNPGPLYHNAPFLFSSSALIIGAELVGMARFDAEECLRLIERHRVTWVVLVPTMMHRIWALPEAVRHRYDLSSLRHVWHMAAPCPDWLKRAWIDWLGPERIWELYGGTEAPATKISSVEWLAKPGSVGRPDSGVLRILDQNGIQCPPGTVGEIYLPAESGKRFHYLGDEPKWTATGEFSLGDLGYLDGDGYLFLADRRTDLILRGGANIYPAEVEAALDEHPGVGSSAVIGLPDDEFGQRVHAIVQPRLDYTIDVADLDRFVATRLAAYKRPRSYEIVAEPLRDEAGKVRRSSLRDERLAAATRSADR